MNTFSERLFAFAVLASLVLVAGCDDSGNQPTPGTPPPAGTISYSGFVSPTFNIYGCTSCHGGSGGLTLTSYAELIAGGNSGAAVIPGNGAGSLLVRKLLGTAPGSQMPLGGTPLPSSKIDSIASWIDQGALNN